MMTLKIDENNVAYVDHRRVHNMGWQANIDGNRYEPSPSVKHGQD